MVDGHAAEDAVGGEQHEVVLVHLQVEHHHLGDTAQVGLQFALELVLIVLHRLRYSVMYLVLELAQTSGQRALAHEPVVLDETSCPFNTDAFVAPAGQMIDVHLVEGAVAE